MHINLHNWSGKASTWLPAHIYSSWKHFFAMPEPIIFFSRHLGIHLGNFLEAFLWPFRRHSQLRASLCTYTLRVTIYSEGLPLYYRKAFYVLYILFEEFGVGIFQYCYMAYVFLPQTGIFGLMMQSNLAKGSLVSRTILHQVGMLVSLQQYRILW